jgi:hypothetical protein
MFRDSHWGLVLDWSFESFVIFNERAIAADIMVFLANCGDLEAVCHFF